MEHVAGEEEQQSYLHSKGGGGGGEEQDGPLPTQPKQSDQTAWPAGPLAQPICLSWTEAPPCHTAACCP